ncbi:MAG: hypothetical protein FWC72_02935 [Oscillospiraceae bacterium]|nr:hypothetical protein [Oscillospiraceae bacterium]
MDFLDYFLWFFAIFAVIYGILLLVVPKNTYVPIIKKQLVKKGNSNPTEEDVDKKLRSFRMYGIVCIVASGLLFYILLTGGIFGY